MKKASNEFYGRYIGGKIHFTGNKLLDECKVSKHEAIKRVLSLLMRHLNIDILYVSTGLRKNINELLKSITILEKLHLDDRNVFLHLFIKFPVQSYPYKYG